MIDQAGEVEIEQAGEVEIDQAGEVEAALRAWVQSWVVGHGLCPFAAPVLSADAVRVRVVACPPARVPADDDASIDVALDAVLEEAVALLEVPAAQPATTLVACAPAASVSFEALMTLVGRAEAALQAAGADAHVQLAHFHPAYVFDGASPDDPANATNRAPYPTVHLLRSADVEAAIASHPDAAGVGERNAARMRALASRLPTV